jgi:SAM-dependent methyltransferase
MSRSLWRTLLYKELEKLELAGDVVDLGGSRRSGYHELIKGEHKISVNNLDGIEDSDLCFNLEAPFPVESASYDAVLAINVLEHIFNYRNVLEESFRILKEKGTLVVAVPFLIQVHPSPNDYWRYTEQTLYLLLEAAGFKEVNVVPVGTGVFGASYHLKHNFYRIPILQNILVLSARMGDWLLSKIKPDSFLSKKYYPLGYLVISKK